MEDNRSFPRGGVAFGGRGRGRGIPRNDYNQARSMSHVRGNWPSEDNDYQSNKENQYSEDNWGNNENNYNRNGCSNNQVKGTEYSEDNYGANENNYNRDEYSSNQFDDGSNDYKEEDQQYRAGNNTNDYGNRRGREDNAGEGGEDTEAPKRVEFYIPPELGNEESEVFSSGITTGINFEKFDDIKVEMNGNNLPKMISLFEDLNLRPILMNNIRRSNYTKPTPIQKYALSVVMAERDLMACAQTGSGKTAAFLLPIINSLIEYPSELVMDSEHVEPQVVIVSPTRELAIQIYQEARKFSFDSDIKVSLVYGGASTGHQRRSIDRGCHIMIATPGRLLDFVNRGWVTFSSIRFVVLDEADRMLSMGFIPAMQEMFEHPTMVPTGQRRTLMFSATFPREIQTLASTFLEDYIFVTVGIIGSASSDVEQVFLQVEQSEKRPKLVEVLNNYGTAGTLVFVETKRSADFLAVYLSEENYKINSIHGDRSQREREEAIRDFRTGRCDILVATSVAARGLDIPNVRHVINFDLPTSEIDEYIHRIGRTGRIGNKGMATSFFNEDRDSRNADSFARILELGQQNVPDWMRSGSRSRGNNHSRPSFGGRDVRHNNNEQQPAYEEVEEEVW